MATDIRHYIDIIEAAPPESMRAGRYYHGTSETGKAQAIMREGLKGQETQGRSQLAPVVGRVYLTPHITYAIIYALGGNYTSMMQEGRGRDDPFGYVFIVEGRGLGDVQPDEDSVGEFLSDNSEPIKQPWKRRDGTIAMYPNGEPYMRTVGYRCAIDNDDRVGQRIYYWLHDTVTPNQLKKIMDGEYAYYAAGGKRALQKMPDWMKIELINRGAHIAHGGSIHPAEAWRIEKKRMTELKKDGSNFFQIAERIL